MLKVWTNLSCYDRVVEEASNSGRRSGEPHSRSGKPTAYREDARHVALSGAMSAITAAVVGVIHNLAVWFGLHVLFRETTSFTYMAWTMDLPVLTSLALPPPALTIFAAIAIFRLRMSVTPILATTAALGVALSPIPTSVKTELI